MSALSFLAVTMITGSDFRRVIKPNFSQTSSPSRSGIMISSRTASKEPARRVREPDSTVGFDSLKISSLEATGENGAIVGDIVDDEKARF